MVASTTALARLLHDAHIRINGPHPWDPQVFYRGFYRRVLLGGSLALGESYADGWWDAERLDEFFHRVLRARVDLKLRPPWLLPLQRLAARLVNPQAPDRTRRAVQCHYDRGNDLFAAMLDPRLVYSCAYWRDATTLAQAQEAKLERVCRKLGLKAGQRVLDIGCGWGSWARYAAERHEARVLGVTLSPAQFEWGRRLCAGLPVELRLQDYREVTGRFDHIVSIGMFEHVGARNYRPMLRLVRERLKDDGLFLLHTIGGEESAAGTDPWVDRYIFPNSMLPSARQLAEAAEGLFVIEDWENFGADYDRTLMAWWENLERHPDAFAAAGDERFRRRWKYYLLSCAGAFRARRTQLWQLVLSPRGVAGGYHLARPRPEERWQREPAHRDPRAAA